MKPKRMWINQPSKLQPYHDLHGTNVLAIHERDDISSEIPVHIYRAYFLSGDVISQEITLAALSPGWTK